ncbi:MAG: DUF4474 domain-containing protein [Clostridia bacterium]|nr:DUF4474 domain-containing protein [Clostridia bacterium]
MKKLLSIILAVILTAGFSLAAMGADEPKYGDVTGNGVINSEDALQILNYDVGSFAFNKEQLKLADVSADGIINSYDALLVLQYAVELIDLFPVEKTSSTNFNDADHFADFIGTGEFLKYVKWYIDEDGNITTDKNKGVLGFAYSSKDKCFYADNDAWQRNFGYSNLYDQTSAAVVISYDTIRVFFNYAGKDWMIQMWKGQYGCVLLGGEVGVYNRPEGSPASTHFNCASDDERLPISLKVTNNGKVLFDRPAQTTWWMTGFVPGQLGAGLLVGGSETSKLSETTTITFKDDEMMHAFVKGLGYVKYIFNNADMKEASQGKKDPGQRAYSFKLGDGIEPGTYSVNGTSVTLTWK